MGSVVLGVVTLRRLTGGAGPPVHAAVGALAALAGRPLLIAEVTEEAVERTADRLPVSLRPAVQQIVHEAREESSHDRRRVLHPSVDLLLTGTEVRDAREHLEPLDPLVVLTVGHGGIRLERRRSRHLASRVDDPERSRTTGDPVVTAQLIQHLDGEGLVGGDPQHVDRLAGEVLDLGIGQGRVRVAVERVRHEAGDLVLLVRQLTEGRGGIGEHGRNIDVAHLMSFLWLVGDKTLLSTFSGSITLPVPLFSL